MRVRVVVLMALAASVVGYIASGPLQARQSAGHYAQVGDIMIGGTLPAQWDYLTADGASKRLYVSHNSEVVVIDTAADKVVGRIGDTPGVHGIAIGSGRVFTTNGRENKVSIVDAKTLMTLSKVDTGGANPDGIMYESGKKEVWAFNHTGKSATEIDAATGKVVATISLSGTAEAGQADPAAGRVFVNIEDQNQVDVIDVAAKKVVANWPVAPGDGPTGMAIDLATHRLFIGADKVMVMMDTTSGKVVASVPICAGTDATWFDPGTKLAFSSCRDGKLTVAHVDAPDKMTVVQTIDTATGAKTMTLDAATHKIYVAAAKPVPAPGRGTDPGSFHVFVYGIK